MKLFARAILVSSLALMSVMILFAGCMNIPAQLNNFSSEVNPLPFPTVQRLVKDAVATSHEPDSVGIISFSPDAKWYDVTLGYLCFTPIAALECGVALVNDALFLPYNLPASMYLHEDGPYAGKIHSDPEYDDLRGITPEFIRLPENMTFELFTEQAMLSEEQFRMEGAKIQNGTDADNKNPDFWIFHNGHGWDEVWKQFSDTPYVMHLYYQGVTEEEIRQVLQNIRLVPAEEETAGTWVPPEDRGPEELEFHFLADFSEATLQEANQWDTPWRGKVVQDAELADYSLENVCQGLAEKGDQSYSALQIRYDKTVDSDYLFFDLIYTNAPVEELPWNETDEDIQIMDYDTFRVCVFTGDCTDEERSGILAAIETAASRETPDEAPIPEPTKDVPWFWLGYGVNSHGETYASAGQIHMERKVYDQLPDLIAFGGDSFKTGYVRKTELFEVLGDDPDDAMNHLMQDFNKTDTAVEAASLNVYDKEGENVIAVIKYYKEP